MQLSLRVVTPPVLEPVTIEEARTQARVTSSDEDESLTSYILAARMKSEIRTHRALITQTLEMRLDAFPRWEINVPRPPLQSVTSITYVDTGGVTQTLSSTLYRTDIRSEPGRITPAYGQIWPRARPVTGAVTITFVAGFGDDPEDVPELIRRAMLLMITDMREYRSDRDSPVGGSLATPVSSVAEVLLDSCASAWVG